MAGNEKDEDEADTVGCSSLRVEHIKLHDELNSQKYVVEFDFLAKDSIRYQNSVAVLKSAYKNLNICLKNEQQMTLKEYQAPYSGNLIASVHGTPCRW